MSYPNLQQYDSVDAGNNLLNSFDGLSLEAGTRNCSSHLRAGFDRVLESILAITIRDGALFVGVKWEGSSTIEFVSVKWIAEKWPIKLLKYYESHLVFLENEKNTCGPVTQADVDAFVAVMRRNTIEKYGIPTEIVDFLVSNRTLFIVVRWVERQTLGCIPAHIAYRKFPKMLISFYDSNVIWMC
jgi:Chromo shadow domain